MWWRTSACSLNADANRMLKKASSARVKREAKKVFVPSDEIRFTRYENAF